MLVVKTILAPSAIEGLGLFAGQHIPKGTIVWQFVPGVDAIFDAAEIEKLPEVTQDICRRYAYYDRANNKYVLCGDDARFENQPAQPQLKNRRTTRIPPVFTPRDCHSVWTLRRGTSRKERKSHATTGASTLSSHTNLRVHERTTSPAAEAICNWPHWGA